MKPTAALITGRSWDLPGVVVSLRIDRAIPLGGSMNSFRSGLVIAAVLAITPCLSSTPLPNADPLAAIDANRNAIITDIVNGLGPQSPDDAAKFKARLLKLRADRLLAASLASTRQSLEAIISEGESSLVPAVSQTSAKSVGDPNRDLVYTPLSPCRLIDTRGYGAPIQGGPFAPNERRAYLPNGLCALPTSGVATVLMAITTQNLTPSSGGYLAVLAPSAPVTTSVDIFNLGSIWSESNAAVATGPAGQFDVLVSTANAHVVVDVLGYFAPPLGGAPGGGTVTSVATGTGLTGGPVTTTGTISLATGGVGTAQLADGSVTSAKLASSGCFAGQILKYSGTVWVCAADVNSGGTVTGVTASAPLASSGGTAPNISLAGGVAGQVLAGTAGAPAWTASPSLSGNLLLPDSSATAGNILKGAERFVHNFGSENSFIGKNAGNFAMTGFGNTGVGANTLISVGTGYSNTAIGVDALDSNTTGYFNTATGVSALSANVAGAYNTAVGHQALLSSTGNWNTAVGYSAGYLNVTGGDNIYINNYGVASESNTARIGGGYISRTFIAGIRGVTTGSANAVNVLIDSAGQLGTVSSSRRVKDDITDMDSASSALMRLRPVTFHYKSDKNPSGRTLQYGLIAEEVAEVYPGLVAHSADGEVETVMYQFLPSMLLNEYQKQQRTIAAQAADLAKQGQHIAELERDRQTQSAQIAGLKAAVVEVAELKRQMAHLTRLLEQQRIGSATAGLELK